MRETKKCSLLTALMFVILGALFCMPSGVSADPMLSLLNMANGQVVQNQDTFLLNGIASGAGTNKKLDVMFVVDDTTALTSLDPANYRNNAFHDLFSALQGAHDVKAGVISLQDMQKTSMVAGLQNVADSRGDLENIFGNIMKREGTSLALGQGIKLAKDELLANARYDANKMIVVLATGSQSEGPDPEQETKKAADNGCMVNFLHFTPPTAPDMSTFFANLANTGNGKAYPVNDPHEIVNILKSAPLANITKVEIVNETTNQIANLLGSQLGAFTGAVPLKDGSNTISVTVHGSDGTKKTETVQITKQGQDPCTANPQSCVPLRPLKLKPQLLMAGFDPIILDLSSSSFKLMALVREGSSPIRDVSLQSASGDFSYGMTKVGSLANGDLLYELTLPLDRGPAFSYTGLFGSESGQFNLVITDQSSQAQRFPTLEFGDNPDLSGTPGNPTQATLYERKGCKRLGPQVLMAGFDTPILDYNDTALKLRAIVRDGNRPVKSVSLSMSDGSPLVGMNKLEDLPNGDHLYEGVFTFPRGSFPGASFRNLWGGSAGQLVIEAKDDASQKHRFPDLKRGDYMKQNGADCWSDM